MVGKRWSLAVICGALFLLGACSGGGSVPDTVSQTASSSLLAEASADIYALPVPDGVEDAVWASLTSGFLEALESSAGVRTMSGAPDAQFTMVDDFQYRITTDDDIEFTWTYSNEGDYDFNGEVNVSDLVSIGRYFGATVDSETWDKAQYADGDGNGEINFADAVPIARNYKGRIDSYRLQVQTGSPNNPEWEDFETVYLTDAVTDDLDPRPRFAHTLPIYQHSDFLNTLVSLTYTYRVVPRDSRFRSEGGAELGEASNTCGLDPTCGNDPSIVEGGRRQSSSIGPVEPGLRWVRRIDFNGYGAHPVVTANGTVYFQTAEGESVMGINASGEVACEYTSGNGYYSGLSVDALGALNFISGYSLWGKQDEESPLATLENCLASGDLANVGGRLYFVSNNRTLDCQRYNMWIWGYNCGIPIRSFTVTQTGDSLVTTDDNLISLDANGEIVFEIPNTWTYGARNVMLNSGEIAVVDINDICILNQMGEVVRSFEHGTPSANTLPVLAIGPDDELYLQGDELLKRMDLEGNTIWQISTDIYWNDPIGQFDFNATSGGGLIVDRTGVLFVPMGWRRGNGGTSLLIPNRSCLAVYSPDGEFLWQFDTFYGCHITPLLYANDCMYVFDTNGLLYSLGPDGVRTPPVAPVGLTATQGTDPTGVLLTWEGNDLCSHYFVFRDDEEQAAGNTTGTSWLDDDVTAGETHSYYIIGANPFGTGETSAMVTGYRGTD